VTTDEPSVRLDLYVRSLGAAGSPDQQETILRRLQHLDDEGVATTNVVVWGKRLRLDGAAAATEPGQTIQQTVEQFEQWAADNGASFPSLFQRREVDPLVGERYTALTLPTLCLAVRVDGALRQVLPCRRGDRHHGVSEFLAAFEPPEAGEGWTVEATGPPVFTVSSE
jgi:hypothetical protein